VKHRQVLDKLAAVTRVRALDEELARWVGRPLLGPAPKTTAQLASAVIPPVPTRWRLLLSPPVPLTRRPGSRGRPRPCAPVT
jgi:hypothetical protein